MRTIIPPKLMGRVAPDIPREYRYAPRPLSTTEASLVAYQHGVRFLPKSIERLCRRLVHTGLAYKVRNRWVIDFYLFLEYINGKDISLSPERLPGHKFVCPYCGKTEEYRGEHKEWRGYEAERKYLEKKSRKKRKPRKLRKYWQHTPESGVDGQEGCGVQEGQNSKSSGGQQRGKVVSRTNRPRRGRPLSRVR